MVLDYVMRVAWQVTCLTALVTATGCANFAPVKAFSDETKKLTSAFDPIPAQTLTICKQKEERKDFITPPSSPFDIEKVRDEAEKTCAPIAESIPGILAIAGLLDQYADTLARLTDIKLPDYKSEFNGIEKAVNGIKNPAGQNLIPAPRVAAIISLAEFLTRLGTQRAAEKEIKSLLEQASGFDAAADALDTYSIEVRGFYVRSYIAWIDATQAQVLPGLARTQGLAVRSTMIALSDERFKMVVAQAAIKQLSLTIAKMKSTRGELRAKLDAPDDDLWNQLFEFAKEVRELRKKLISAT